MNPARYEGLYSAVVLALVAFEVAVGDAVRAAPLKARERETVSMGGGFTAFRGFSALSTGWVDLLRL